jgi:hypothetical protein
MKKTLLLIPLLLMLSLVKVSAMDRWEILLNKQVIFKGTSEQENPTLRFKTKTFKKTDSFTLRYTSENPQRGWNRTFYVTDSEENNLKTVTVDNQSGQVSVKASAVKELMGKKHPVFIYTTSLPKDPSKAATVRVRRILVCKVEWI